MSPVALHRHNIYLLPDCGRVILRPFIPSNLKHVTSIIGRVLAMSEEEASLELETVKKNFSDRHLNFELCMLTNYQTVRPQVFTQRALSSTRQLLIGAMFLGEYALEASALFNPSIVLHPDQSGVPDGGLRFIMSLRATGEGHISSIEFRTGNIAPDGNVNLDPVSRFVCLPEVIPNPTYRKNLFLVKLHEMGFEDDHSAEVIEPLAANFTLSELDKSVSRIRRQYFPAPRQLRHTLECIHWLAVSNYELSFDPKLAISERAIFPVSPNESNGIEDARFVRFTEDDGTIMYYATYTAYNGRTVLPQLIETQDFTSFRILTLNGTAVQNKGMALFPRRIDGSYAMISRQDDENLFIMFSDNPHYWNDPKILWRPTEGWESVKIGNCGSPIETEAGWLLLTHGVGPMRTYCIGAMLLDLDDPTRVIGHLRNPLIISEGSEREGYVPNVVYSCGSLLHNRQIVIPYAISDRVSVIVSVSLDELLAELVP